MSNPSELNLQFESCTTAPKPSKKRKRTTPMTIRVTDEEKAMLKKKAGPIALSTYAREQLLGDEAHTRPKQYRKKQQRPTLDHQTIAQFIGLLGQSELATSLLSLMLAAQSGDLSLPPDVSDQLQTACDDIHEMRCTLITALNIKAEDGA